MKFGKLPARHDYRTLRLSDYLMAALPPPPAAVDNLGRVYHGLGVSDPQVLFPIDGNDQYGDCTICALAHLDTVFNGLTGSRVIMPAAQVERIYFQLSGGVDSGLACLDVLNYWRKHKVSGDNILAFVKVSAHNHDHVKQAMALFGGLYIGFQCQQDVVTDFEAGKPWTPGPLTNSGHAVVLVNYDDQYLTALTWGSIHEGTWAWLDECCDEAYAILPAEAKLAGFSAQGFNLAQLKQDLQTVAG